MKYLPYLSLLIFLNLMACKHKDKSKTVATTNPSVAKVEVIDFYGTHRCVTCKAIEANTKYTLDTYFSDPVKKGALVFKAVNVDKEENFDIAERFEATGTALFLNVIKDGKEKHIDLTDFAFAKGKDKDAFSMALKNKIEDALKSL